MWGMQSADLTKHKEIVMQKIILAALKGAFPGVNLDALVQVVEATPNVVMATELLLGVWEEPEVLPYWRYKNNDGSISDRTLVEVNHWTGKVNYIRNVPETKIKYFPKHTTKEQAMQMVGKETSKEVGDEYEYFYIPTGVMKIDKESCTVEQWTANHCEKLPRTDEQLF